MANLKGQQPMPLPPGAALGHEERGAPTLKAYLVNKVPCLPLKRFSADAGYNTSVSPSGRAIAVAIGSKLAVVFDAQRAQLNGKELPLSVVPFKLNGDVYLPLDFYEKVYPAKFQYDPKRAKVSAVLPRKTLTVPVASLPAEQKKTRNPSSKRTGS